jgi:hypothetical protein
VIFYVHVRVALARPPQADETRRYAVEAEDSVQAEEIALQMAACTSVMPVWSKVVGDEHTQTYRQAWRMLSWGAYADYRSRCLRLGCTGCAYHQPKARCDCHHPGQGMAWHEKTCPAYRYLRSVIYT